MNHFRIIRSVLLALASIGSGCQSGAHESAPADHQVAAPAQSARQADPPAPAEPVDAPPTLVTVLHWRPPRGAYDPVPEFTGVIVWSDGTVAAETSDAEAFRTTWRSGTIPDSAVADLIALFESSGFLSMHPVSIAYPSGGYAVFTVWYHGEPLTHLWDERDREDDGQWQWFMEAWMECRQRLFETARSAELEPVPAGGDMDRRIFRALTRARSPSPNKR